MREYGVWIKRYWVLCSKMYSAAGSLLELPAGSQQAARGTHNCETRLSHAHWSVGWNYSSIPKLQPLHRWSLEMDKQFHRALYNGCNYLSMLGLKLTHVSKRGPGSIWTQIANNKKAQQCVNRLHTSREGLWIYFLEWKFSYFDLNSTYDFLLRGPFGLDINWRLISDKPIPEPIILILIGVIRHQYINTLMPRENGRHFAN